MKSSELGLGNLVWNSTQKIAVPVNLKIINEQHGLESLLAQGIFTKDDSLWEPVPITEKWLEKLGFIKEAAGEYYIDAFSKGHPSARFEIEFRNKGVLLKSRYQQSNDDLKMRHIKYIHQLQNLFHSLVGEELTVP